MASFNFFFLISLLILLNLTKHIHSDCWRASVYEHILVNSNSSLQTLSDNFAIFEKVVKRAAFIDAKIIIFPEYGLIPLFKSIDELLNSGAIPLLPKLNENLCSDYKKQFKEITESELSDFEKSEKMRLLDQEKKDFGEEFGRKVSIHNSILRKISCLAHDNHIYIAINLVTLEIKGLNDEENKVSLNLEENLKLSKSNSELEALKLSDQLINEKLNNQLEKINSLRDKPKNSLKNSNYNYFNTELVFDNQGILIAKYKKYYIYGEKEISRPKLELVTFNTEFGKFGISTCSDIIFENPIKSLVEKEKIDHLILSSSWPNELPFLSSTSFHSSNAVKYGINILSANKRNFKEGSIGSGIFNGKTGVRVQTSFDNHNRLLIADLPMGSLNNKNDDSVINENEKVDVETLEYSSIDSLDSVIKVDVNELDKSKNSRCSHYEPVRIAEETYQQFSYVFKDNTFLNDYRGLQTSLDQFKFKRLVNTEGKITDVCDRDVCCELEWKMNDRFNFASDNYLLIASSKLKQSTDSSVSWYGQSCALVSYSQAKPEYKLVASTHFDKLSLRGKFNTTEIFPNVISSALYIVPKHKWIFKQIYNESELTFDNIKRPITFVTLYGRVYHRDSVIF